jgi:hypothetical protein
MTDGQSSSLSGCRAPIWRAWPDFCFLSESCWFLDVGRPLWRGDGSIIYLYNCFWDLPEQSPSDPNPAELTTIFYCLIWDSSNLEGHVQYLYLPQEQGCPVILPGTGFPFRRLLRLAGLRWRYSNPPLHGNSGSQCQSHVTTGGQSVSQSVSMSWCRAPSGSHDQMFVTLRRLLSCLLLGRPLWREVWSALYHTKSAVYLVVCQYIYTYLHFVCLTYKVVYIHYI